MLTLKFNADLFFKDLSENLLLASDEIMAHFVNDVGAELKATDFSAIDSEMDTINSIIHSGCVFYALSIMESYGTGVKMDTSNEYLPQYMQSKLWNPLRPGLQIVGRKEGSYTNIFGEESYSSGNKAGLPVGFHGRQIARKPSYAIQNAEKKLYAGFESGGYAERTLSQYAEHFMQTANMSKYFYNVEVNSK